MFWNMRNTNSVNELASRIFNIPEEFIYVYDAHPNLSPADKEDWVEFLNAGREDKYIYKFMSLRKDDNSPIDLTVILSKNSGGYISLEAVLMFKGTKIAYSRSFMHGIMTSIKKINQEVDEANKK